MKKIAVIIILAIVVVFYFLVFNQNNIPACNSAKSQVSSLVKNILGQTSSQKSITFEVVDMQETKVYEHSRICKAKLNFEDGTDTSISYAVERNKLGVTEVRIIPGG
ncbi:hypothetical protein QIW57_02040 [Francisellaceae bacterium CB52]|jgi:predicted negative regulator of RcsB-dependent stress response